MSEERVLDVAVIGASSAGLFAAWHLSRSGKQVTVFEREDPWNPARRTLIITPYLRRLLPFDLDGTVLHETPLMAVASGDAEAVIRLREPDLIIERSAFLRLLAREAERAGATLRFGHRLVDMWPEADGTAVLTFQRRADKDHVHVRARAVIGADGVLSQVVRLIGAPRPPAVPILQAEVTLPSDWDPGRVQVWFDRDASRFFYWLIPESSNRGVVGLVADKNQNIRRLLTDFLDRLGLHPLAYQGAQVAMYTPRLRPWGHVGTAPVYLVGDAAGQVKVTTVGGTVTGLWGAWLAARALVENVPYRQLLRPLKRELDLHWLVRVLLDRLSNRGYEALIRALTPRVRHFLSTYTRDEMAGRLWKLALTTPALWRVLPHLLRRPPAANTTTAFTPESEVWEADY